MKQEIEQQIRDAYSNPKQVLMTSCGYGFIPITNKKALENALDEKNNYNGERCFCIKSLNPYNSSHDFITAQQDHGKYVCFKAQPDVLKLPIEIDNKGICVKKMIDMIGFVSYEDLSMKYTWQDGYPCGIIGDEWNYINLK